VGNERAGARYEREGFTVESHRAGSRRRPRTRGGVARTPAVRVPDRSRTSLTAAVVGPLR
jgi:hypothetical protein